ncbi:MAG: TetR/AcrR family transcriptional regulator [Actinomycetota bacterium]
MTAGNGAASPEVDDTAGPARTRSNNRAIALLDAAAVLFASQGYHRTTIRDVTSAIGMRSGSSYYHFASKAEMLLAVYDEGIRRVQQSIEAALLDTPDEPWPRLEAALTGHIAAVLDPSAYARTIVAVLPSDVPELSDEITARRDAYEHQWRRFIGALDAPVDPALLRVFLLSAANSTQTWYREGGASPAAIAHFMVDLLRRPLETT